MFFDAPNLPLLYGHCNHPESLNEQQQRLNQIHKE